MRTMSPHRTPARQVRAAAAGSAAVLLALLTGCSSGAATAPAPAPAAIGSLSVESPRSHLELTGAVLRRSPSGGAELTVTIRNEGSTPEHLSQVSTAADGRATLRGSPGPENALSPAGVLIRPGESAVFGGDGPGITFPAPAPGGAATATPGTSAEPAVDTVLIFGVAGLVHLRAAAG